MRTTRRHDGACEPLPVKTTLPCPAGLFKTTIDADGDLMIKYDQFPAPNDNSYGVNAVGWGTKGHTFGNLVGCDHAGVQLVKPGGVVDARLHDRLHHREDRDAVGLRVAWPVRW